ncbi:RNA polymerase sigma factor [Anaerolentibacter hominis]|uniref:RNA polymerase sigma factor n=1 Tax=Anaerolentibacter hominis TaxID=3079009 RepID=UPI0031B89A27
MERFGPDKKSFIHQVVEEYSDMIFRIAYQNLRSKADAEDITQDVFLRLMQEPEFEKMEYLKAWLIRVAVNRCRDHRKSAWFRKTEPLEEIGIADGDPEQSVWSELWKLPAADRTVVYLHYYEGYSIREIAKILDQKENTVGSRLTRARKKLKDILLEGGYSL